MSTGTAPVLISVHRVGALYIATCGATVRTSTRSGPDAAKAVAAAKLGCEPDRAALQKHAPGVFRASVLQSENRGLAPGGQQAETVKPAHIDPPVA